MSKPYTAGSTLHLMGEAFNFDTAREAIGHLKHAVREGERVIYDMLTDPGPIMCECELDWVCGPCRAAGVIFTPIERMNDEWASRQGGF